MLQLRNDVKRIKEKLENLSCRCRFRSLLQAILYSEKRNFNGSSELFDLVSKLDEWGPHAHDNGVHIDKFGAEVHEIGVVTVYEVDQFVVQRREVVVELRTERVEGNEGSEFRNVRFGVEVRGQKRRRFEP